MTTTAPPRYRACGTTDDITTCEKCGKEGLKSTVIIEFLDADGNGDGESYLGSDCAARMLAGAGERRGIAARITREAQAAGLRRTQALAVSQAFMAYYAPFAARQDDPQRPGDRGAYLREYRAKNPLGKDEMAIEQGGDWGYAARRAMAALARHREVIATGGRSALA